MSTLTQPAPPHRTPLPIRRVLLVVAALLALFLVLAGAYNLIDVRRARRRPSARATTACARS